VSDVLPEEQFASLAQQAEVANLGMWVFLATEVMFFGGLFASYMTYWLLFPTGFAHAAAHTELPLGSANTVILLTSSLTMAMALANLEDVSRRRSLRFWLGVTVILGLAFIAVKGTEYVLDYREHLVPALDFAPREPLGAGGELFFLLYFIITLIHAVHMSVGIVAVGYLWWLSRDAAAPAVRKNLYENIGLYWSFVDVMWIFIFTLLYLPGRGG
jgi:cytochrome c oxidase subunit III